MNLCFLGIGSNQSNPERQLRVVIKALKSMPHTYVIKVSRFCWTKAWGLSKQQDFCNAVVAIRTTISPLKLLFACQQIEKRHGRVRKKPWGPRIIDIDILLYADKTICLPQLIIPHPYMLERDFVLKPLNEIM